MIKSKHIIGKPLVTIQHGEIIGRVKDVLIDPERYEVAALVVPGKLLSRKTMVLPRSQVHVFGADVILVKSNEVMVRDDTLENVSSLIAARRQLKGQAVVTEQGLRVGIVDDLYIDEGGRVVSKRIPLGHTRSLGLDVVIVDSKSLDLEMAEEDQEPASGPTG
jgi:uncharacterized protein YrrD